MAGSCNDRGLKKSTALNGTGAQRETDVPTEQTCAQTSPRLSRPHGDGWRPEGPIPPSGQRPQAAERLSARPVDGSASPSAPPDIGQLKTRAEFLFVRQGARANRGLVGVEARRRAPHGSVRFGLTASKKVGGAPARNRARRRLREAARQLLALYGLDGVDYVFVARAATPEAAWPRLLDDLRSALISVRSVIGGHGEAVSGRILTPGGDAQ